MTARVRYDAASILDLPGKNEAQIGLSLEKERPLPGTLCVGR